MIAGLLAAVALQTASPADVVVTAQRQRAERRIARQIDALLPPLTFDQPLARFAGPVCPGVAGLSIASAQAVVDRIGAIADTVGLKVGAPGCAPNLLVVITPDGRGAVKGIVRRHQGNVRAQSLADVKRILAEPGAARAWVESEVRSRDGDRATTAPDAPPSLTIQGASRAALGFRRDIVSAIVVIDAAAIRARDIVQLADYAAMRGLSDARPGTLAADVSILSAFTPSGDAAAPTTLTALDMGILRGLYAGQGNVPSGVKRGMMARAIAAGAAG